MKVKSDIKAGVDPSERPVDPSENGVDPSE
jgi:hypothetical protein